MTLQARTACLGSSLALPLILCMGSSTVWGHENAATAASAALPTAPSADATNPVPATSPVARPAGSPIPGSRVFPQSASPGPSPGYHKHDGFYMRLTSGVGYLQTRAFPFGKPETVSGSGLAMDLAFGGAVGRNVIIFMELSVASTSNPKVEWADGAYSTPSMWVALVGFGPGVAYYFAPLNLYLSGALLFPQVQANDHSANSLKNGDWTDTGVGTSLLLGKEWWISADWALGATGMLQYASMKLTGDDSRMKAVAVSVLLSATYN